MDWEPLIQFIQNYSPASRQVVEHIAGHYQERVFGKHDYFIKAGKISDDYLFLGEGFMRAFTFDTEGNEVTTYFYPKNRFVFDVSSFYIRAIATENIQVVTPCTGYSINFETLNALFHSVPEFREFGRAMLAKEFVAFKHRTLGLINKSAEERYNDLIESHKEIFQHAQLKHIASYLGVTDTSLSRIRNQFLKHKTS